MTDFRMKQELLHDLTLHDLTLDEIETLLNKELKIFNEERLKSLADTGHVKRPSRLAYIEALGNRIGLWHNNQQGSERFYISGYAGVYYKIKTKQIGKHGFRDYIYNGVSIEIEKTFEGTLNEQKERSDNYERKAQEKRDLAKLEAEQILKIVEIEINQYPEEMQYDIRRALESLI